jgi:hypothetical protein
MNLNNLTNYNSAFRLMRFVTAATVACCFIFAAYLFYITSERLKENNSIIYIIDPEGKMYSAEKVKQTIHTRLFEYENHVKNFYTLFNSYDQFSYKKNIEAALNLIGDQGRLLYDLELELDTYSTLREKNLSLSVEITDIHIDINTVPLSGTVTGVQTIRRLQGELKRNMNIYFTLKDVSRSKLNPHGVLIDIYKITDNTILE